MCLAGAGTFGWTAAVVWLGGERAFSRKDAESAEGREKFEG